MLMSPAIPALRSATAPRVTLRGARHPPTLIMAERILQPGRNCWRIERAARVAFLVDGQAYFTNLYHGLLLARRSIYVLAWDINSRFKLLRDQPLPKRWPVPIGELLNALVKARSRLHAYVLD